MNANTQRRFHSATKEQRQAAANHARQSKHPKVAGSADKFCRRDSDKEYVDVSMQGQAKMFYGACYKEN